MVRHNAVSQAVTRMNENGNTALITGASSGIGLAMSRELARMGYPLLMVSNEAEKLAREAAAIEAEYHVTASALYADLSESGAAQKLFDYCSSQGIKVSILINNAGIFFFGDIVDTRGDKLETAINLQVRCPTLLCKLFAEQMIREKRAGYIVNMSSIAARMMMPGIAMYNAVKSYLRCFSRAMRNEVFEEGVSVTTLSPGAAATGLYNMPERYMKLGVALGVIIPPEKLARKALKQMFRKKAEYTPAPIINALFIGLVNMLGENQIRWLRRKTNKALSRKK